MTSLVMYTQMPYTMKETPMTLSQTAVGEAKKRGLPVPWLYPSLLALLAQNTARIVPLSSDPAPLLD